MSKKSLSYTLWTEKYRPESVNQIILPSKTKQFFSKLVKEKEIPNLLFYSSSPGCGKTTTAKALVNDIGVDYIYVNTSSEGGIDTLRNRIAKFATSYSLFGENNGGKKICILDEFDGSTAALQAALRAFMEEFQDSCRFILTCNYVTKIIEPLKSRCQLVDFNLMDNDSQAEMKPLIIKRLAGMLKNENIEFNAEIIPKIVENFYPDVRRMINLMQQYSKKAGSIDNDIFNMEKIDTEFYNLILNKKLTAARKYVMEKNYNHDEIYHNLFENFVPMLDKGKQAQAILLIAEYSYRSNFMKDLELNMAACLLELIGLL